MGRRGEKAKAWGCGFGQIRVWGGAEGDGGRQRKRGDVGSSKSVCVRARGGRRCRRDHPKLLSLSSGPAGALLYARQTLLPLSRGVPDEPGLGIRAVHGGAFKAPPKKQGGRGWRFHQPAFLVVASTRKSDSSRLANSQTKANALILCLLIPAMTSTFKRTSTNVCRGKRLLHMRLSRERPASHVLLSMLTDPAGRRPTLLAGGPHGASAAAVSPCMPLGLLCGCAALAAGRRGSFACREGGSRPRQCLWPVLWTCTVPLPDCSSGAPDTFPVSPIGLLPPPLPFYLAPLPLFSPPAY